MLIWFQDGLFAAFLSAFLVFLIPQLQPNNTDAAIDVLIHISQQISNSTTPAFEPAAFQVSSNAVAVNMLLFLSLTLVLIDAFLAMLVKGWLQEFDRGWRKYTVAHLRAQERERRMQALQRWKLYELVALLPILIQGSLMLFCIGLLVLIFPLHLLSGIFCSLAFVSCVGFYCFTTYVSIVDEYAPFSSPVSRLLARGVAILQTRQLPIIPNTRRSASAISSQDSPPLPPQDQRAGGKASGEATQPLPSNNGVGKPAPPYNPDSVEKSEVVPRSRSDINPQMHVNVLERLVTTTAEAVDNIPIFLELLDQPVKDVTLQPFNVEKWKELLHITLGLLRDQSTFSVSAACTLARTMMICFHHKAADQQLCLTLQYHLDSPGTGDQRPRVPLNLFFSSCLPFWLGNLHRGDMWRTIAFLAPNDSADAELLWMVNTFHRTMRSSVLFYLEFFVAVLTYVSSTEQSRRSQVPLTAAVVYAIHTIRSALDQGDVDSINGLCILPGTVSASGPVPMTFCQVDGIGSLDLWSENYVQFVKDLLQWHWPADWHDDFQLSLIAALYIDSTKQAHARSIFADLLKYTSITYIQLRFSGAYDSGKLAVYWYMAVSQKPVNQDGYPLAALYDVIESTITQHSTLQLPGLHILEIAVRHVHKASPSSDWLKMHSFGLQVISPGERDRTPLFGVDHWVLLHLDTLLAPQPYLLPEAKGLEWSDARERVYIAKARLELYDSLAKAGNDRANRPEPDPEILRVFLWCEDYEVCTRAFNWCLDLVTTSQPGTLEDTESTRMFIPDTMGYEWVEHFIHVLCEGSYMKRAISWELLISSLHPKWTILPSSWCYNFASVFLFSTVCLPGMNGLPAYQHLAEAHEYMSLDELQAFLPFLAKLLTLVKSNLNWARLTSFENWLARIPETLKNGGVHTQMEHNLATRKQQLIDCRSQSSSDWLMDE